MKTHHCNIASTRTTTPARLNFSVRFLTKTMTAWTAALLFGLTALSSLELRAQTNPKAQQLEKINEADLPQVLKSIKDQLTALGKSHASDADNFATLDKISQRILAVRAKYSQIWGNRNSAKKALFDGIAAPFINDYASPNYKDAVAKFQKNWSDRAEVFKRGLRAIDGTESKIKDAIKLRRFDIGQAIEATEVNLKNLNTFKEVIDWANDDIDKVNIVVADAIKDVRQRAAGMSDKKKAQEMLDAAKKVEEGYKGNYKRKETS